MKSVTSMTTCTLFIICMVISSRNLSSHVGFADAFIINSQGSSPWITTAKPRITSTTTAMNVKLEQNVVGNNVMKSLEMPKDQQQEQQNGVTSNDGSPQKESTRTGFSYGDFAKQYPFTNNVAIASTKTAAADLMAQVAIAHTPISGIEWDRTLLFFAFGAIYSGGFQYFYQVNIFKRLFNVDKFTSQSWSDKFKDREGLMALAAQTALDLTVLTLVYLPTFYVFKAGVFSGSMDPWVWTSTGIETWQSNFAKDEFDLIRVWMPADLVCFSVPLYLRLPVRHGVSFLWTTYLSFVRGGH